MKKVILKRISVLILAAILVVTLFGCNQKTTNNNSNSNLTSSNTTTFPMNFKDALNRDVNIVKAPKKIVSLAPAVTETIFALNANSKLVGRTDYCTYPQQVKDVASMGNMTEPSMEKIVASGAELVLVTSMIRPELIEKITNLGITVVVVADSKVIDDTYNSINLIGKICEKQNEANNIITEMKTKIENASLKVKDLSTPSVYYVVSYGSFGDYTAGTGTFIDSLIKLAGGKNSVKTEGWKYSLEQLVSDQPEIIIVPNQFDTKAGFISTTGYKDLDAVKNEKVIEINTGALENQSPRQADAFVELAKAIHPEAFQ